MASENFADILERELQDIVREERLPPLSTAKGKGMAFELWIFNLFNELYSDEDLEKDGHVKHSNDHGIDIIFPSSNGSMYLIQAKNCDATSDAAEKLFSKLNLIDNPENAIMVAGEDSVRLDLLQKTAQNFQNKDGKINLWFFTTGKVDKSCAKMLDMYKNIYSSNPNVDCKILGLEEMEKLYYGNENTEPPPIVTISLDEVEFFQLPTENNSTNKNVTLCVRGSVLRELLKTKDYASRLFIENIRKPLGERGLTNPKMIKTLIYEPENFFYYNNGVSAICKKYDFDDNKRIIIKDLQIINGAQTSGALSINGFTDKEKKDRNGKSLIFDAKYIEKQAKKTRILIKLTSIENEEEDDENFKRQIIRYNNTQNKVEMWDFRANDPIQRGLKEQFEEFRINYIIKRGRSAASKDRKITNVKMAVFAKIWLAWGKNEPWETSKTPAQLVENFYEKIFGDENQKHWKGDDVLQAAVAIHALAKIENCLKEIKDKGKGEFQRIQGFKMFALALFKIYFEKRIAEPSSEKRNEICENWLKNEARDDKSYEHFLSVMADTIKTIYRDKKITGDTPNTTIRQESAYKKTKAEFEKRLKASKGLPHPT